MSRHEKYLIGGGGVLFLLLLAILVFYPSGEPEVGAEQGRVSEGESRLVSPLEPPVDSSSSGRSAMLPLTFVDRLTGKELDSVDVSAWNEGHQIYSSVDPQVLNSEVLDDAVWRFQVGKNVDGFCRAMDWEVPAELAMPDERGVVRLPFSSQVRVVLVDSANLRVIDQGLAYAWTVSSAGYSSLQAELQSVGLRQAPYFVLQGLENDLRHELRHRGSSELGERVVTIDLLHVGEVLIEAWSPGYSTANAWVDVVPGEVVDLSQILRPQPVICGYVVGSDGATIPEVDVTVGTVHSSHAAGMSGFEREERGFSLVYVGRGAEGFGGSKRTVRTDKNGWYSMRMPEGSAFSASVQTEVGFGFSSTDVAAVLPDEKIRLDVEVVDYPNGGQEILVVDPDGIPVSDVRVRASIRGDAKWQRQFPELISNSEGVVVFPAGASLAGADFGAVLIPPEGQGLAPTFCRFLGGGGRLELSLKAREAH